jgi:serine/threonine protein kinase/Flp pilus assembly protein TadD
MPVNEGASLNAGGGASGDARRDEEVARVLGGLIDRLCAGEKIEREAVRSAHPSIADEILAELETLQGLGDASETAGDLETLGRHRILRRVGRGGMGIVYEAIDEAMDRHVALKVLPREFAAEPRAVARFVKEAKVAGRLRHPNIVPVYGMGIDRGLPFYAMEFIEGQTLAEILEEHRPPSAPTGISGERDSVSSISRLFEAAVVDDADDDENRRRPRLEEDSESEIPEANLSYCIRIARAFAGVADGLAHAHARGVIHRDIKPSNLILDGAPGESGRARLRILDFGLARVEGQESLTRSGDLIGTVLYMSPEQAMARRVPVDHRTDLYSLGAALYEALTWTPPFKGRDHRDTLSQIIFREVRAPRRLNPRIPRDLETIVLKCLAKDPRDRYATAEGFAQDLRRFARGDPIEARPLAAWERLARLAWRKRALAASAAAISVAAIVSALLLAEYREEDRAARNAAHDRAVLEAMMLIEYAESRPGSAPSRRVHSGDDLPPTGLAAEREIEVVASRDALARALESLDAAAALAPARPEAVFHRARALLAGRRRDEARALLASVAPRFPPARALAEVELAVAPDLTLAAPAALKTAGLAPDAEPVPAWPSIYARAQLALYQRRREDAVAALDELLDAYRLEGEPYLGAVIEARLARGRALLELRRLDEALRDFAAVQALQPGALEPTLLLARAFLDLDRVAAAREELDRLQRLAGFEGPAALRAVEALYRGGDHAGALAWVERIDDASASRRWQALCLSELGHHADAIAIASALAEREADDFRAHHVLGTVRFTALDVDGAIAAYERAAALAPEDARCWRSLGDALINEAFHGDHDYERAFDAFLRAAALDPRDVSARTSLAYIEKQRGRLDEAERRLDEAAALDPASSRLFNLRGLVAVARREHEAAIEWYAKASQLDPKASAPWSNMAWAYRLLGRFDEGLAPAKRALELRPGDPEALKILGNLYFLKGMLVEAREAFANVVEMKPRYGLGHYNLGRVLEALGETDAAIVEYEAAILLRPRDFQARYNLGNVLLGLERFDEAIEAYRGALADAAGRPEEQYIQYNLAEAALHAGDLETARRHFERAAELDPRDPESWASLAAVHERSGRPREAVSMLQKAMEALGSIESAERREELRRDLEARLERLEAKDGSGSR